MRVELEVPDQLRFQLVYRLERSEPYTASLDAEHQFMFLSSAPAAVKRFSKIVGYCGYPGAIKAIAKLISGKRSLYLVSNSGKVVSAGWCSTGFCRFYRIEPEAVVIGPIWTRAETRGKGLASSALQLAINAQIQKGRRLFYIDTEKMNLPAQRVFAKSGFGPPVALFLR
jgi:hypothetical protein